MEVNTKRVRYILTAAVYGCYFAFGAGSYLVGPSRYDIADSIGSDFQHVSYGAVTRASGYSTGALIAGFIFARSNRQLGYVTCLSIAALAQLVVPFLRQLWQYLASELTYGLMAGSIDVATNSWMLEMWDKGANPYMQGMHFSYAVGMTIAPLSVAPFLSKTTNVSETRTMEPISESRIVIPYSITAGLMLLAALNLLILFFKVPYVDLRRTVSSSQDETDTSSKLIRKKIQSRRYQITLIILGCILLCGYSGFELNTFGFVATFATNIPLNIDKKDAAIMTSVMSGTIAISRFTSIFIATKISTLIMLCSSTMILLTGNVLLIIFASTSKIMIWIGIVMLGMGHSCVYPSIMSFLEERINVTTTVCSFFMLSSCTSAILIPIILGNFIEQFPLTYVYINLIGLIACSAVFVAILLLDRRTKKRIADQ